MDTALAPVKTIGMNVFVFYMGGNSIRMFTIMLVAMALINPIKSIMGTANVFSKLDPEGQVRFNSFLGLYHVHNKPI